jgi:hypothetical protein
MLFIWEFQPRLFDSCKKDIGAEDFGHDLPQ